MAIHRRSFMAAIGAAFSASVLAGKCLPQQEVNWDYFTDFDAVRWDLSTPWLSKSRTIATDGRILFAAYKQEPLTDDPLETRRPSMDCLPWDSLDLHKGWQSSDSIVRDKSKYEERKCEICLGTGRVGAGVRKVLQKDEVWEDMQETWVGGKECQACNATLFVEDWTAYRAGGEMFCPSYVERIRSMGEFDFVVEKEYRNDKTAPIMLYRNALGCGFLMGLAK